MPTFIYKAVTPQGQIVKNKINEANKESCINKLKQNGLIPISVSQMVTIGKSKDINTKYKTNIIDKDLLNTARVSDNNGKKENLLTKMKNSLKLTERITGRDIRVFTQNFYLLKKAKFNNVHALSTVIDATENYKLKIILKDILAGVESGEYMYTTMEYYQDIFPYIYINMIKVGELSGSLDLALEQAVKYLDDTNELERKLRQILVPNIVMFVGLLIMLFAATIIGVPILQRIFDQIGTKDQLPAITLWFAGVVDWLIAYWYIPTGIIAIIIATIYLYVKTPEGKYKFHRFKYTMPIFGNLIYALDFTRLMRNTLLNLQNGMRIQDSLEVSKNVLKNEVMISLVENAINNIYIGQSWIDPFENEGLGTPMPIEMLKIGMQTDLSEMMEKLLVYMEVEIDNTMKRIMKVLPELSYAIVGSLLIFFVLVVLVPCIQVYMGGWLFSAYGY